MGKLNKIISNCYSKLIDNAIILGFKKRRASKNIDKYYNDMKVSGSITAPNKGSDIAKDINKIKDSKTYRKKYTPTKSESTDSNTLTQEESKGFSTSKKIIGGIAGVSAVGVGGSMLIDNDKVDEDNIKRY